MNRPAIFSVQHAVHVGGHADGVAFHLWIDFLSITYVLDLKLVKVSVKLYSYAKAMVLVCCDYFLPISSPPKWR